MIGYLKWKKSAGFLYSQIQKNANISRTRADKIIPSPDSESARSVRQDGLVAFHAQVQNFSQYYNSLSMPFFAFFERKLQVFKHPSEYIFVQKYFWTLLEKYYMVDIFCGHVRVLVKKKLSCHWKNPKIQKIKLFQTWPDLLKLRAQS